MIFDYSSTLSKNFFVSHSLLSYSEPSLSELDRMGREEGGEGKGFSYDLNSVQGEREQNGGIGDWDG